MGRLIDADILIDELKESAFHHCNNSREDSLLQRDRVIVRAQPTVDAISKSDYENRLKADMVAMLEELKYDLYHELCKEIHGKEDCPCTNQTTSCLATFRVCDANEAIYKVIQQKINSLKENENGNK